MLRKHSSTIVMVQNIPQLRAHVQAYFGLEGDFALTPQLYQRGLGQADLVLCLLRSRSYLARKAIERLIGHPILVGEPCLLKYYQNGAPTATRPSEGLDRRIAYVVPRNPRAPATDAWQRWKLYRVGRTLGQLRVRGINQREIRTALRAGWIRLES